MSLDIKTATNIEEVASFISSLILNKLNLGKKVLFFVTGGSSIIVSVKVSEILRSHPHQNLTVMLTDERYGPLNHNDSNWHQLKERGFSLPQATLIPILVGDERDATVQKFNEDMIEEFKKAYYKIGLFGIGADGHTAGILSESIAVNNNDELACGYSSFTFSRITMTPKAIAGLDEAVVFTQGKDKMDILEKLKEDINIIKMPAQILKKVPLLTIFNFKIL